MGTAAVLRGTENPYPGPRAFHRGEKLFGRSRELAELVDLVVAQRIVLLYAASGAGKSSLVDAALIPALEAEGFAVLPTIRVGLPPAGATNRYACSVLRSLNCPDDVSDDVELATRLDEHWPIPEGSAQLLVFDQFEEAFTADPTDLGTKRAFFEQLGAVLRDRRRWALFVMREDQRSLVDPYLRHVPTRFRATYRLELLGVEAAMAAIREPARASGVEFKEAAARMLAEDLSRVLVQDASGRAVSRLGPHVEPVHLQVACRTLWERLSSSAPQENAESIDVEDVRALGDVGLALRRFHDACVARVASKTGVPERVLRDWIEKELVAAGRLRGQVVLGEETTQGLPNEAVGALVDAHLVRAERRLGATWFELAHDRLVEPVLESNAEWRAQNLSALQRQAADWNAQGRPERLLLLGSDLAAARTEPTAGLTQVEAEFLERSGIADAAARRGRRLELIARWSLVAVALLSACVALYSKARVERERALHRAALRQEAERLAGRALSNMKSKPQQSLLIATRALDIAQELESGQPETPLATATLSVLERLDELIGGEILGSGTGTGMTVIDARGRWLSRARDRGVVWLWDLAETEPRARRLAVPGEELLALGIAVDSSWLAACTHDGHVVAWDLRDRERAPLTLELGEGQAHQLAVSAAHEGIAHLAVAGVEKVCLYELPAAPAREPNLVRVLPAVLGRQVTALAFSDTGARLAWGSRGGTVGEWTVPDGRVQGMSRAEGPISLLLHSPGGGHLAWASTGKSVQVMDTRRWVEPGAGCNDGDSESDGIQPRWSQARELVGPSGRILSLAFSPDGQRLAAGCGDAPVRVWRLDQDNVGEPDAVLSSDTGVLSLRFDASGTRLLGGAMGHGVIEWKLDAPVVTAFHGHERAVRAVAYRTGDARPVSVSDDGTLRAWDPSGPRVEMALWHDWTTWRGGLVAAGIAQGAAGEPVPVLASGQEMLEVGGLEVGPFEQLQRELTGMACDPASPWVILADASGATWAWRVGSPTASAMPLEAPGRLVTSLALEPRSGRVAIGRENGSVSLATAGTSGSHELARRLDGRVGAVAFDPPGRKVAAGFDSGLVVSWALDQLDAPPAELRSTDGEPSAVTALAFELGAADRLAVGSAAGELSRWDLSGIRLLDVAHLHEGAVRSIAFRPPDSKWVATAGDDQLVKLALTDLPEIEPMVADVTHEPLIGIAWAAGGTLLAATASGRAWSLTSSRMLDSVPEAEVRRKACLHAGRRLDSFERSKLLSGFEGEICPPEWLPGSRELPGQAP